MHGSADQFHRNDALDSPGFFAKRAGLEQPDFTRNQFGGVGRRTDQAEPDIFLWQL